MQIENTVSFEEICNLSQNCSFFKICMVVYHFSVLRIRIRWIRKIWASWIRIQWAKYQLKNEEKKFYTQNPNLNYWKREIIKISWFQNGSSGFSIKISEKIRQKIWKFCLRGRGQKVDINGTFSDLVEILEMGLVQGSSLSCLLFIIYVNDFFQSNTLLSVAFADDTNVASKSKNLNTLADTINKELEKKTCWYMLINLLLTLRELMKYFQIL